MVEVILAIAFIFFASLLGGPIGFFGSIIIVMLARHFEGGAA